MDKRVQVDVINIDSRKAFDKISHLLMLHNLELNGVSYCIMMMMKLVFILKISFVLDVILSLYEIHSEN